MSRVWRQLLSLGVAPRDLVVGKAVGVAAALGLILIPSTLVGVAALSYTSEFAGLLADLPRAAFLTAVCLVYFATFVAISLGVSAHVRSSRTALVTLLVFWFVNSLIVTRAAADLVAWLHPTPSAVEFQRALEQDLSNPDEMRVRLERRRQDLMRQYHADSMAAVPVNFSGISLQEGEEHGNEVFDAHYGRLFETYGAQNRAFQWVGIVAPMLPIRSLSMALAGTDFAHHREFVIASEGYRRGIQRVMNDDIARNAKPGVAYVADAALWSKVPVFSYELPSVWWALGEAAPSLIVLFTWLIASMWFAAHATRRLTVD